MTQEVFATKIVSVSQLKSLLSRVVDGKDGEAVAVLSYKEPVFYCVPPQTYERLLREAGRLPEKDQTSDK